MVIFPSALQRIQNFVCAQYFLLLEAKRIEGIFVGPTVLERDIEKQYGVHALGATPEVSEEFFAISVERRITHPCATAITLAARTELFAPPARRRARRSDT